MKFKRLMLLMVAGGLLTTPALADTLELTGVIRDFKRGDWETGHLDFETAHMAGRGGYGHVLGLTTMTLDADAKPEYNPVRPNKDTVYSADTFAQWFRDVPDVNASKQHRILLDNGQDGPGGVYTWHSTSFFPIDLEIFGNQELSHNFHFTFELNTEFVYEPGQYFTFIGDDDVWVYINGTKVIDLGGVHSAITGSVLLFDGKAFVEQNDFPVGAQVQQVDSQLANHLAERWSYLALDGACPIGEGATYIELNLNNNSPDVRAEFDGESVTVFSGKDISNVVLKLADGSEEKYERFNDGTTSTTITADQTIDGVWVKSASNATAEEGKGVFIGSDGSRTTTNTLDFYFAERHTTQSNFRIDTSMNLTEVEPTTVSPLYD